ncbi:MAG: hypothetical protein M3338_05425, partial [Actinomycetota bacterium]|nr:hypothetical protein [Actinomycetota bacterium]
MPVPVCLNPYCKGFSTISSVHSPVGFAGPTWAIVAMLSSKNLQRFSLVTVFVTLGRRTHAMVVRQSGALAPLKERV